MKKYIFSYVKENFTIDFFVEDDLLILYCIYEEKCNDGVKSCKMFEKVISLKDIFERVRQDKNQLEFNF